MFNRSACSAKAAWREQRFTSSIEYDLTDEHGKVILEKIEEDKEETE